MKRKMLSKGDLEVDELERDFLNEVCHMRMEIAYKRLLQTRTHKEAKRTKERDEAIEELYQQVEKECTDEGKSLPDGFDCRTSRKRPVRKTERGHGEETDL